MPTSKQQREQDDKQRKRVQKEIERNISAALGKAFSDSLTRLKGITDTEWQAAVEEEEIAIQAEKGKGPGRGWWGPPKGTHGKWSGLFSGFPSELEDDLTQALMGVPAAHLEGLDSITAAPPKELGGQEGLSEWQPPDGGLYTDEIPDGAYVRGTIHVNPKQFSPGLIEHELGHHVCRDMSRDTERKVRGVLVSEAMSAARFNYPGGIDHNPARPTLSTYGLRRYSLSNEGEFLADAYKVWLRGSREQWTALNDFVKDQSGLDLESAFLSGGGLR